MLPSLPEFVIYTLQWGAGRGASAGLALGGVGHLLPLPEPENVAGAELETEPGATLFLLPIAVALATPCPLSGPSRCSGDTGWLKISLWEMPPFAL